MIVARDIVRFSIPFSLGIAIGVLAPIPLNCVFPLASILILLVALALFFCVSKNRIQIVLLIALLLGCICGLCSQFGTALSFFKSEVTYQTFLQAINNIGFEDKEITALASALLTGYREELSPEIIESFRKAGASHILALSGFHFGIIYAIIDRLLFWMNYQRRLYTAKSFIIIAFSIFYTSMTGASPSLVRALLFVILNEIYKLGPGRKKNLRSIFCTALMIQLLMNPQVILSLGFQLSYLAMLGIALLYPHIRALYNEEKALMFKLWEIISLSISCQATTAPLVWIKFRTFPRFFLITNLIALPLVTIFISLVSLCLGLELFDLQIVCIRNLSEAVGQLLIQLLEIIGG